MKNKCDAAAAAVAGATKSSENAMNESRTHNHALSFSFTRTQFNFGNCCKSQRSHNRTEKKKNLSPTNLFDVRDKKRVAFAWLPHIRKNGNKEPIGICQNN